ILEVLGIGVLGIVYKARHLALKRTVALKMIAVRGRLDPARLAHFRAEAEAAAKLHHPNIVEVYDFGEDDGEPYVAREYVEGGSLAGGSAGALRPAEQTAALVETLARAVHHAHLGRVVHGGLKPSKVLLGADGTPKITGFGLARALSRGEASPTPTPPPTGGGGAGGGGAPAAGLPSYLAPEQLEGRAEAITPATDVYALGGSEGHTSELPS